MKRHTILCLLGWTLLLTSCIKEDRSDCQRSFTLLFRYEGDGTTDIFPDKVTQVQLYVYDTRDGALLRQYTLQQNDLRSLQGIRLDDLAPGTYEAVCWGNAGESSQTAGEERRESGIMAAPEWHAGQEVDTNDELYHANHTFTITGAYADQQDICLFHCAHIDLTVRLEGFDNLVAAASRAGGDCPVGLRLDNMPGHYDFSMQRLDEATTYRPVVTPADDDPTAYETSLHTLRFADDGAATLCLTHPQTDEPFYRLPLRQFLADNGLSVENREEVALDILLRLNNDGVTISVTPFEEESVQPGLDERGQH